MGQDASKVRVGVTGAVYVAQQGTELPEDATGSLESDFEDVGYISDDGVSESHDTESEDIVAWQKGETVRQIQTSHELTFAFTMIETSEVTLREYYGNYSSDTVKITGEELPHRSWVLSVIDGNHVLRIVIPDGQVTEREDVEYIHGGSVGRGVTITCFPVDGVKATVYLDDGSNGSGGGTTSSTSTAAALRTPVTSDDD